MCNDLFLKMETDYTPERIAIADEYIAQGLSIENLRQYIMNSSTINDNVVSAFFYICNKIGNNETLSAWDLFKWHAYENTDEYVYFLRNNKSEILSKVNRHIYYAIQKYLIPNRASCFIKHIEKSSEEAISCRKELLEELNRSPTPNSEYKKHRFYARLNIQRSFNQDMYSEKIPSDFLSEEEINIASKIVALPLLINFTNIDCAISKSPLWYFALLEDVRENLCRKYPNYFEV